MVSDTNIQKARRFVAFTELFVEQGQALMANSIIDSRVTHDMMMQLDKFRINLELSIDEAERDLERQSQIDFDAPSEPVLGSEPEPPTTEPPVPPEPEPPVPPEPPTTEPSQAALRVPEDEDDLQQSPGLRQEFARAPSALKDSMKKNSSEPDKDGFDPLAAQASSVG